MIQYRPDIDGLRAIAVISVIFFHLGYSQFRGGYVGVDVFFVISGYLITLLIRKQVDDGSFSFAQFYVRRAMAPDRKLILYDERHLTPSGAKYLSEMAAEAGLFEKLFGIDLPNRD